MNKELSDFAARLREVISVGDDVRSLRSSNGRSEPSHVGSYEHFDSLALELFRLQFKHNDPYRKICEASGITPDTVEHWMQIPAVPTTAFKELEFSCLSAEERTAVFHSSGTTEQKPSRHYHNPESLALYEVSLWSWFARHVVSDFQLVCLTPPPHQVPHSSLVHMFETIRKKLGAAETVFAGTITDGGAWTLDFDAALSALQNRQSAIGNQQLILGTAFSFVHLLDFLREHDLRFQLPFGSRVMETGGYKNRSRTLPKEELHALITERLGVPSENIVCEYGMSELSSQAYDDRAALPRGQEFCGRAAARHYRVFYFPPWARVQIISPESGRKVANGETGLIRVFDLANVFSVMAIQTEDLGTRHGDGFELLGRAQMAEPRGCSLMSA